MTTLSEYKEMIERTFKWWLDTHTKADVWADERLSGYDDCLKFVTDVHKHGGLRERNPWDFSLEFWVDAALKLYCDEWSAQMTRCSVCGSIWDAGFEDCDDDCDGEYEYDVELEDLYELLSETSGGLIDTATMCEHYLYRALETTCFEHYRENVVQVTAGIEDEVQDVLRQIKDAKDDDELLTVLLWANHVAHASGEIVQDYGDDELIDLVDEIAQDGAESALELDDDEIPFDGEPQYTIDVRAQDVYALQPAF